MKKVFFDDLTTRSLPGALCMHADIVIFHFSLFNSVFCLPLLDLELGDVLLTGGVSTSLGARCAQDRMRVWNVAHTWTPRYAAASKQHDIWRTERLFLTTEHGNNRIKQHRPIDLHSQWYYISHSSAKEGSLEQYFNRYKTNISFTLIRNV